MYFFSKISNLFYRLFGARQRNQKVAVQPDNCLMESLNWSIEGIKPSWMNPSPTCWCSRRRANADGDYFEIGMSEFVNSP